MVNVWKNYSGQEGTFGVGQVSSLGVAALVGIAHVQGE